MAGNKQSLFFLEQYPDKIPDKPGNYFWYYYPQITDSYENMTSIKLSDFLNRYSQTKLTLPVPMYDRQKKFSVILEEVEFYKPLGLSEGQFNDLITFILKSESNFNYFKRFFEKLCFLRPFYIGKAIDLRSRLKQHIEGKSSSLLDYIYSNQIPTKEIIIEYEILNSDNIDDNENLSVIFEKILQAKLRPTLVKKHG